MKVISRYRSRSAILPISDNHAMNCHRRTALCHRVGHRWGANTWSMRRADRVANACFFHELRLAENSLYRNDKENGRY